MEKTVINGEFSVMIPDGYVAMTREELNKIYVKGNDKTWAMKKQGCPESPVNVIVDWEDYNPVAMMLLNAKDIAKRNEQLQGGAYAEYGYQKQSEFERSIAGQKAAGYRFIYTLKDTDLPMAASAILFKHGKRVYKFTCLHKREDQAAEAMFESFLDSAAF